MKYEYFVSFMVDGSSFGNATCSLEYEIKSIKDYEKFSERFAKECKENGYKSVIILNFVLLGSTDSALERAKVDGECHQYTEDELKRLGGKPIWHQSLAGNDSKWRILEPCVAANPKDYLYEKTWVAYNRELESEKNS